MDNPTLTCQGGKVGIGTLSPLAKLSIDSGKIYFQGDNNYSSYGISFYHEGSSLEKKILYYSGSTDKRTVIRGVTMEPSVNPLMGVFYLKTKQILILCYFLQR